MDFNISCLFAVDPYTGTRSALMLMNVALACTACGQILSLFEFAFALADPGASAGMCLPPWDPILSFSHIFSPKSACIGVGAPPTAWCPPNGKSWIRHCFGYPESKERGKQLEELEHKFDTDEESPDEKDMVSKKRDQEKVAAQSADADELKPKHQRFSKCCDELMDLVPLNRATPIMPSTTAKLSETGVPEKSHSSWQESEERSIYRNGMEWMTHAPIMSPKWLRCVLTSERSTWKCVFNAVFVRKRATAVQPFCFILRPSTGTSQQNGLSPPPCLRVMSRKFLTKF